MASLEVVHSYHVFGQDYLAGHVFDVADADKARFLNEWRQVGALAVSLFKEVERAAEIAGSVTQDVAGAVVVKAVEATAAIKAEAKVVATDVVDYAALTFEEVIALAKGKGIATADVPKTALVEQLQGTAPAAPKGLTAATGK